VNEEVCLQDNSNVEEFESAIIYNQLVELYSKIDKLENEYQSIQESNNRLIAAVSKYTNQTISDFKSIDDLKFPISVWCQIFDDAFGKPDDLIRPSHQLKKYSLTRKKPELEAFIPTGKNASALELLTTRSSSRAFEIVNHYTSENTRIAHMGDLVYWQAWLSAIGFTFEEPICENEIIAFIIQHVEGLDVTVDKKLVDQGFKSKLGPHKLATVKRRIGSLSVFLHSVKWVNPCHTKNIQLLCQKLTKKYGSSKPAGKAITKDILDDMLETCGNKLIDIRDKAVLLFAWGSGGRRRSEVSSAEMKNLIKTNEGDYFYKIPQSKTDQEGKGNTVPVKGRVAKALSDWLSLSGITDGAIFRSVKKGGRLHVALSPIDINRIVKIRLKKAGYNEKEFGAHSLRSGFVTEAGRKNKPLGDVMALTTHKSISTVMRYYQAGSIINNSAADLAD
jgi:integrase